MMHEYAMHKRCTSRLSWISSGSGLEYVDTLKRKIVMKTFAHWRERLFVVAKAMKPVSQDEL